MTRIVPPEVKELAGTARPDRQVVTLFADVNSRPDPEDLKPPAGMSAAARKLWAIKVNRYRQRNQKVDGLQESLRAYCELEALLNDAYKRGTVTMAMVNAHRLWCAEFYDTPASQRVSVKPHDQAPASRFARLKQRTDAAG